MDAQLSAKPKGAESAGSDPAANGLVVNPAFVGDFCDALKTVVVPLLIPFHVPVLPVQSSISTSALTD